MAFFSGIFIFSSIWIAISSTINDQIYKNFELIIIDQSNKIDNKLKDESTIKYFFKPKINSLVEAKKYSLKHIKTEYVGFLDDDVELDKNLKGEDLIDFLNSKKLN